MPTYTANDTVVTDALRDIKMNDRGQQLVDRLEKQERDNGRMISLFSYDPSVTGLGQFPGYYDPKYDAIGIRNDLTADQAAKVLEGRLRVAQDPSGLKGLQIDNFSVADMDRSVETKAAAKARARIEPPKPTTPGFKG